MSRQRNQLVHLRQRKRMVPLRQKIRLVHLMMNILMMNLCIVHPSFFYPNIVRPRFILLLCNLFTTAKNALNHILQFAMYRFMFAKAIICHMV